MALETMNPIVGIVMVTIFIGIIIIVACAYLCASSVAKIPNDPKEYTKEYHNEPNMDLVDAMYMAMHPEEQPGNDEVPDEEEEFKKAIGDAFRDE